MIYVWKIYYFVCISWLILNTSIYIVFHEIMNDITNVIETSVKYILKYENLYIIFTNYFKYYYFVVEIIINYRFYMKSKILEKLSKNIRCFLFKNNVKITITNNILVYFYNKSYLLIENITLFCKLISFS